MVTLQDIADKTGFSRAVVSRALNPYPDQKVAARTREIIQKAAEEMGYQRNQAASLLAKGASPSIGVFLPGYPSGLIYALIQGVCRVANRNGFAYNIYSGINEEDYTDFLHTVHNTRNAGIITYLPFNFMGEELPERMHNLLAKNCQVVVANSRVPIKHKNVTSVLIDNYHGGVIAARHLLERKCASFFCQDGAGSWQRSERARGFEEELLRAGVAKEQIGFFEWNIDVLESLHSLIKRSAAAPVPVGIFCNNDDTALLLMRYLAEAGMANLIGSQFKIVGFDDSLLAEANGLTTIRQPFEELGAAAMTMLVNRLTNACIEVKTNRLLPELIIRQTT